MMGLRKVQKLGEGAQLAEPFQSTDMQALRYENAGLAEVRAESFRIGHGGDDRLDLLAGGLSDVLHVLPMVTNQRLHLEAGAPLELPARDAATQEKVLFGVGPAR
jgi:hypothetical protein